MMLKKETKTKAQKCIKKKKVYVSLNKKCLFDSEQVTQISTFKYHDSYHRQSTTQRTGKAQYYAREQIQGISQADKKTPQKTKTKKQKQKKRRKIKTPKTRAKKPLKRTPRASHPLSAQAQG